MRKTILIVVLSLIIMPTLAQEATPEADNIGLEPRYSVQGDGVTLDVYFTQLKQGRVGLLGLQGEGIHHAQAEVFRQEVTFFKLPDRDGWWALFAAEMEQTIRRYDLTVTVAFEDAPDQALFTQFDVISGGFISQTVTLVPDDRLERLLDPEIEANELARIFDLARSHDVTYWHGLGFAPPLVAELTSPFGAVRVFNEALQTVHTGWDFNAPTGTPLLSMADGVVALATQLDIRGNYVLVDHGQGIYSGYAHLSVIYVTQGQSVQAGQILGLVGSTGRSSSAHAHFEMIVDGKWIDPVDFLQMAMP